MTEIINNITIIQGETYYLPPFEIDGDWTGGTCRGQIRNQYLYLSGTVLAYFQFETLTYDADTNKTTVTPYIDHQFTSLIPPTKWKGAGDPSDRNAYVFDIEIEKGGKVWKYEPKFVGIIPEVTDNSVVFDPPIAWDGSIDRIELTETNGLVKTYTVWGTPNETVNLGEFDVADGEDGEDGVGVESVVYDQSTNKITVTLTNGTITETGSLKGEQGLSAYQIAVNDGFVGSESQWRESLKADLDSLTIKTRYESNVNTNAFTDAEKTKLVNLETTLSAKADLVGGVIPNSQIPSIAITQYLGNVANVNALLALTGEIGDWATRSDTSSTWILAGNNPSSLTNWVEIVTSSSGVNSVNGYQGTVVLTYSDVGAASAAQGTKADTALQPDDIGVSVQSYNANTVTDALYLRTDNNYTNTEKTKLAGIEAGAQANVQSDWNATSGNAQILNKPTLGTAAATNASSYATSAQGAKADTALQPANIGVSVQPYDVNTVIDASYIRTDNNYTNAEKTKLSQLNSTESLIIAASDETSNLTVGTNKVTFRMPYALNLTGVRASVNTAPVGSMLIIDINQDGASILGNRLSIDATEKTSVTAATPATITTPLLLDDAEMTIDIDQIDNGTAKGLKITLLGSRA